MWVSSLKLAGFRNYSHLDVKLNQGMTLFFGDNGNGKTNLVEAIYYLSNLDSHRNSDTKALINKDSQAATAIAEIRNKDRNLLLAAEINSSQPNKYFINGNQQKKTSDFLGALNSVIFAPEDLDLVRRDPSDRRRFLDLSLTQLKPRMAGVKADYERVLKQRNALLKSAKNFPSVDLSTLDIWDQQLVELGNQISMARLSLIQNLKPLLQKFYSALAGTDEVVDLALEMNIGVDDSGEVLDSPSKDQLAKMFHEKLAEVRPKELERGITLVGPHRDELRITKAGLPTRTHASQGEAWSIALGLRLAMAELLRQESQSGDPVLILDDVFAVLDAGRRKRLLEFVADFEQVLVTSADRESTPKLNWASEFEVSKGGKVAQL